MAEWAAKLGQYGLRAHDWLLQSNLAAREMMQIDQQYLAAEMRSQISATELSNHRRKLENAREVAGVLRENYNNQELYGWMIGEVRRSTSKSISLQRTSSEAYSFAVL